MAEASGRNDSALRVEADEATIPSQQPIVVDEATSPLQQPIVVNEATSPSQPGTRGLVHYNNFRLPLAFERYHTKPNILTGPPRA